MAFYSGEVYAKDLFSTLVGHITAVQPGESSPWWVKESSLDSDGVYTSTGSTGDERIVIVLREGTVGSDITVGIARDYTPGDINTAGAFDTLTTNILEYYNSNEDQYTRVKYNLSVTPDRVIIHVQGDKLISNWQNSVAFLGMPVRYDINDKKCVGIAISEDSSVSSNGFHMVEDSINRTNIDYNWYYVQCPDSPSWGNNYFAETLHFGLPGEGLRGELDGIYGVHQSNLVDGDEIEINGTRFIVIKRQSYGSNSFPRPTLLMRKS